jgi:hypothetical protein
MRIVSSAMLMLAFASTAALSAENKTVKAPLRPFIVGGNDARIEDFPYQVQLVYLSSDHTKASKCGGSVIHASWVLTAAHCIQLSGSSPDPNEFTVFTGASVMPDDGTANSVSKIVIHPNYSGSTTLHNDIALVKLEQALQQPSLVRLAPPGTTVSGNVMVSGFGRATDSSTDDNKHLKKAILPVVPNDTCSQVPDYSGRVLPTMMCAGFPSGSPVTCDGDSGGPVTTENTDWSKRVQVGIVSFGGPSALCSVPNEYDVYTRVSEYIDWIAVTILQDDVEANSVFSLTSLHPELSLTRVKLVVSASRDAQQHFRPEVAQQIIRNYVAPRAKVLRFGEALGPEMPRLPISKLLTDRKINKSPKSFAHDKWHDVILFEDGTVIAIQYLGLGDGENGSDDPYPRALSNIAEVGARNGTSYAYKSDGTLVSWDSVWPELKRRQELTNCHPDC